jgi:AcrR family transcriptional regulator
VSTIGTKGVPRAERQEQIVAVAVAEFAARGYAGASMVDIAKRAGISKPLIYQYFGSKDGLYRTCLRHVADALLERISLAHLAEDDSVASRVHTLQAIFEALEPQRTAWRLLYDTSLPPVGEIASAARG